MDKAALTTRELRTFSLGLAGVLAGLGGLLWWRSRPEAAAVSLVLAVVSLALGLALPAAMRPLHRGMTVAGHALGWFNTRLFLGLMFYLVFTPAALILKLLGRDPLHRKADPGASTYWVAKGAQTRGRERYEKMF